LTTSRHIFNEQTKIQFRRYTSKNKQDKEVSISPNEASSAAGKPQEAKQKLSIPELPDIKEPDLENDIALQPQIGRSITHRSKPPLEESQVPTEEKTVNRSFGKPVLDEQSKDTEPISYISQEQGKPSVPKLSHLISEKKDEEEEEEFDLFRYIGIILRRKNAVFAVTLLFTRSIKKAHLQMPITT
jgi:hypothetical protein